MSLSQLLSTATTKAKRSSPAYSIVLDDGDGYAAHVRTAATYGDAAKEIMGLSRDWVLVHGEQIWNKRIGRIEQEPGEGSWETRSSIMSIYSKAVHANLPKTWQRKLDAAIRRTDTGTALRQIITRLPPRTRAKIDHLTDSQILRHRARRRAW